MKALTFLILTGISSMVEARTISAHPDGPVEFLTSKTQTMDNTQNCEGSDCNLKAFSLTVDTYRVHFPDGSVSFGTRSFARYETQNIESLEDYGLVQFLKGCQFTSDSDGGKHANVSINIAGKIVDYRFSDWIIDGMVRDPMDWGNNPQASSRHYFYQWNRVPGSMEKETRQWYGLEKPTNGALYVTDHPGTAFYIQQTRSARNISVQFRTCIFKTRDVPRDVEPKNVNFAKPIRCFDWDSSFIYNFQTAQMESKDTIDPFCATVSGF